jgi:hypothetical protein
MEGLSVESLVKEVLERLPDARSTNPPIQKEQQTEKIDVSEDIRSEDAEQILSKLDELDDKKVDELLRTMLSKKEES